MSRLDRVTYYNAFGSGEVFARGRTPMPKHLCLEENYEETAEILAWTRTKLSNSVREVRRKGIVPPRTPGYINGYFDFSTLESISPATALILASEYDRSRSLVDWSIPIINLDRWSPSVVSTLSEIGFFDLLSIAHPPVDEQPGDTRIVQFMTGEAVSSEDAAKLTNTLAEMILGDVDESTDAAVVTARMNLFGALIEAIENTIIHAYEGLRSPVAVHRWWISGAVDRNARHINLVVYDQGLSIPETLPTWDKYGWIEGRLARWRHGPPVPGGEDGQEDAAKLRLAMKVPRSSTMQSNRGKGFPAFQAVLSECQMGKLRIVSRRGEFLLEKGKKASSRLLNTPLTGTLVEWDLWL